MNINTNDLLNSIFYPRKSHLEKDSKDYLITIDNTTKISSRLFLEDKNNPTIIFFHGNAEIAQDYNDIAAYYHRFNLNLIVVEYRGYGFSDGFPTKDNLLTDAITSFNKLKLYLLDNKFDKRLFVMGRSLGSASAFHIAHSCENEINGCIIESGFATEYSLLQLMNINPDSISYKLDDGFMNLSKLKNYTKPLLIIHSDMDDIIPISQAEMIYLESPSKNKDFFKVSGANHNNILTIARNDYFIKIQSFIDGCI